MIDDDTGTRHYLLRTLTRGGNRATALASGKEGIAALEKNAFDVVIIDIQLGNGIDGIITAKIMRAIRPETNIILISADMESLEQARAAGFRHAVAKPISLADMKLFLNG